MKRGEEKRLALASERISNDRIKRDTNFIFSIFISNISAFCNNTLSNWNNVLTFQASEWFLRVIWSGVGLRQWKWLQKKNNCVLTFTVGHRKKNPPWSSFHEDQDNTREAWRHVLKEHKNLGGWRQRERGNCQKMGKTGIMIIYYYGFQQQHKWILHHSVISQYSMIFAFLLIQTDLQLLKNDIFSHNRGSACIKDK